MRREDKQVLNEERIEQIIKSCDCCRLGFVDENKVYIVPLSFGYIRKDGKYIFYFHGADEGRKIDLIRKNHYAGFEMDINYRIKPADTACGYTARYQSVIGSGSMDIIEDLDEKKKALDFLMNCNSGKSQIWNYSEEMLKRTCLFYLEVEEMTCKEHD